MEPLGSGISRTILSPLSASSRASRRAAALRRGVGIRPGGFDPLSQRTSICTQSLSGSYKRGFQSASSSKFGHLPTRQSRLSPRFVKIVDSPTFPHGLRLCAITLGARLPRTPLMLVANAKLTSACHERWLASHRKITYVNQEIERMGLWAFGGGGTKAGAGCPAGPRYLINLYMARRSCVVMSCRARQGIGGRNRAVFAILIHCSSDRLCI